MSRTMHCKANLVIHEFHSKTLCGRTIDNVECITQGIATCSNLDVTHHGALVTCKRCLAILRAHAASADTLPKGGDAEERLHA